MIKRKKRKEPSMTNHTHNNTDCGENNIIDKERLEALKSKADTLRDRERLEILADQVRILSERLFWVNRRQLRIVAVMEQIANRIDTDILFETVHNVLVQEKQRLVNVFEDRMNNLPESAPDIVRTLHESNLAIAKDTLQELADTDERDTFYTFCAEAQAEASELIYDLSTSFAASDTWALQDIFDGDGGFERKMEYFRG
jgi:prophage DNA circulation protein